MVLFIPKCTRYESDFLFTEAWNRFKVFTGISISEFSNSALYLTNVNYRKNNTLIMSGDIKIRIGKNVNEHKIYVFLYEGRYDCVGLRMRF